jgi:hypothetical protein
LLKFIQSQFKVLENKIWLCLHPFNLQAYITDCIHYIGKNIDWNENGMPLFLIKDFKNLPLSNLCQQTGFDVTYEEAIEII